ncbi:MAG: secretin and TonB N-terminal domain-containing protein [Chloroflexi bacterium]|nr:secretin and TonB N-terminal domain-containing protein [Chloroflexota bacterium]
MNLVADPSVQGTLTISLKDVTPEGALALILKMSGYSYKRVDNTLIVGPEKVIGEIPAGIMDTTLGKQVTFNVALDKAPPEKVAQTLQAFYGEQIKVIAVPGINEIAITAPESKVRDIRKKAAELDVAGPGGGQDVTPPPMVEMPIQLKFLKIKDVKDALTTVAPGIQPLYDTNLNLVILRGTQEQVTKAKNYLGTLESSSLRQLIRLDVKVVDLTERGSKELGVTWSGVNSGQAGILDPIELTEVQPTPGQIGIGYFARSATALQATINFLVSNGEARIVASPSIIVLSGNEAKIEVGETYPFVFQDPRSGQYQLQNIDYTTKLKITPTASMAEYSITDPDKVMLEVNIDVADLRGTETSLGIPVRGTKMVDTKVIVRHTETLVIGGLISVEDDVTTRKVPLLGDLPIIGRMFTQDSRQKTNREVVIMITPTLLRDGLEK